jgi:hypothetical protein
MSTMTHSNPAAVDEYETFLAKLSERDRRNVRKQVAACEGELTPDHVRLWKRLACMLGALTDKAAKTTGMRAVQFFIADGAYQMQVFALEDQRDGTILVYAPDALEAALSSGVIRGPVGAAGGAGLYEVAEVPGLNIEIEVLSATNTVDAPDYYRHLLGWNRQALRIKLRTTAGHAQVDACERLCRLAAERAAVRPVVAPGAGPVRAAEYA